MIMAVSCCKVMGIQWPRSIIILKLQPVSCMLRVLLGMTQKRLSELMGCSQQYVSFLMTDFDKPLWQRNKTGRHCTDILKVIHIYVSLFPLIVETIYSYTIATIVAPRQLVGLSERSIGLAVRTVGIVGQSVNSPF